MKDKVKELRILLIASLFLCGSGTVTAANAESASISLALLLIILAYAVYLSYKIKV